MLKKHYAVFFKFFNSSFKTILMIYGLVTDRMAPRH